MKIMSISRFESYLNQFKNDIYLSDDEYNIEYNNEEEKEDEEEEKIEEFKNEKEIINNNIINVNIKDIDELVEYINSSDIPFHPCLQYPSRSFRNRTECRGDHCIPP